MSVGSTLPAGYEAGSGTTGAGRFRFEAALPSDGERIREILEEDAFPGAISISYTRRGDTFGSFMAEGERVHLSVCRDTANGGIAGIGACAIRKAYISGRPEKTGYLFSLRGSVGYRNVYTAIHRGYDWIREREAADPAKLYYTTILSDNADAIKLLEKKRGFMPRYVYRGRYTVYTLASRAGRRPDEVQRLPHGFSLHRARESDTDELTEFLAGEGRSRFLRPVLERGMLGPGAPYPGIRPEDFYLLRDGKGDIAAAGAAWDTSNRKQYLLKGYRGAVSVFRRLSPLLPAIGLPDILSAPGTMLSFFTLSFFASREGRPDYFDTFVEGVSRAKPGYRCFMVGLHERDPFTAVMSRRRHIPYRSRLYFVDLFGNAGAETFDGETPYLECGML